MSHKAFTEFLHTFLFKDFLPKKSRNIANCSIAKQNEGNPLVVGMVDLVLLIRFSRILGHPNPLIHNSVSFFLWHQKLSSGESSMNPAVGVEKFTFHFLGSQMTIYWITKKLFGTNENDAKEMEEH